MNEQKIIELTVAHKNALVKIQELEAFKKEALEIIFFYSDKENWIDFSKVGAHLFFKAELPQDFNDENRVTPDPIGGEKARDFLKKHGEK